MYQVHPTLLEVLVSIKLDIDDLNIYSSIGEEKFLSKLSETIAKRPYIQDGSLFFSLKFGHHNYAHFYYAYETEGTIHYLHSTVKRRIEQTVKSQMQKYSICIGENSFRVNYNDVRIEYLDVALNIEDPIPDNYDQSIPQNFYGRVLAQYMLFHESRKVIYEINKTTDNVTLPMFDILVNEDIENIKYPNVSNRRIVNSIIERSMIRYYTGFIYDLGQTPMDIDRIMYTTITAPFNYSIKNEKYMDFFNYALVYFIEVLLSKMDLPENYDTDFEIMQEVIFGEMSESYVLLFDCISKDKLGSVKPLLESFIENYPLKNEDLDKFLLSIRKILNGEMCKCTRWKNFFKIAGTVANHTLFNAYKNLISTTTYIDY